MMMEGISKKVKRSTIVGMERILTPRRKAGFPWGKDDKYGGIIFNFRGEGVDDSEIKQVDDLTDEESY